MISEAEYQKLLANQARANAPIASPTDTPPRQRAALNKWEEEYAKGLELLFRSGEIDWWKFEGVSLKLADGARYTPDFAVFRNGILELHEVKGFFRESAKVRFKVARDMYRGFIFMCLRKKKVREGGGWERIM